MSQLQVTEAKNSVKHITRSVQASRGKIKRFKKQDNCLGRPRTSRPRTINTSRRTKIRNKK